MIAPAAMSMKPASFTVRLHRVLRTTPAKVYRAFTEAGAFARWLPPFGFTAEVHGMDVKVGGAWRMSFINFTTGGGVVRRSSRMRLPLVVEHRAVVRG